MAAASGGAEVLAAGHLRRAMDAVQLDDVCSQVRAIGLPVAPSSREAERRWGPRGRRAAAAAQIAELPVWAVWLRRLLAELEPDVVHAHLLDVWGGAATLARARPLVATAWGSDLYLRRGIRLRLGGLATRWADAVTVPEPAMAALIGAPVHHVDLGVDLDRFVPVGNEQRQKVRAELGLGEGPLVFSFRAPTQVYRLELVVDAFELLSETLPEARLIVAHGPLPLSSPLADRLGELDRAGRARVLGSVPHERMPTLLSAADVGISVPASDGSPRSVWECLACGTPVVLSDLPRIRDRIGDDRGALFTAAEPADVAATLATAIGGPGAAVAAIERGRPWVAAEADRAEHRRRLGRVYEEVAVDGAGSRHIRSAA